MKAKSLVFLAATLGLAAGILSCGGGAQQTETAPAATAGKPVDTATAGSVSGTIKLDGAAPKMKVINMAAEPNCAKVHTTPAMTEDVVVGDGGALANVVVYLKGDFSQYSFDAATSPVTIDQKGCQYTPHVLALRTSQPLQVNNDDQTTHNIHPVPANNKEWNESQPPGAAPITQSFAREEIAVPVKCNVHPWMKSYIAVLGSPYFQVTGKDGAFELKNVPPGTYTLTAWHELYKVSEQSVTVGPKEAKTVALTFKATAGGN
jgi:Polysaccharide lyase family 4, domain II